jgi:hypothetical protein
LVDPRSPRSPVLCTTPDPVVLSEVICIGQPVQIYEVKLRPQRRCGNKLAASPRLSAHRHPDHLGVRRSTPNLSTSSAERLCCTEQSGLSVDFAPNYDGRSQEPVVLPSRLPSPGERLSKHRRRMSWSIPEPFPSPAAPLGTRCIACGGWIISGRPKGAVAVHERITQGPCRTRSRKPVNRAKNSRPSINRLSAYGNGAATGPRRSRYE